MNRFALWLAIAAIAGHASWYSSEDACGAKTNDHPGCPTASGASIYELENGDHFFLASNNYPLGSWVKVTHEGKTIRAKVVDRGGFDKYGRIADLSRAAFRKLAGSTRPGTIRVQIERTK